MSLTIIAIIMLSLCVVGLSITILLKKGGTFPVTEVGANPNMRKLGLRCPKEEERQQSLSQCQSGVKNQPYGYCTGTACAENFRSKPLHLKPLQLKSLQLKSLQSKPLQLKSLQSKSLQSKPLQSKSLQLKPPT